MDLDTAPASEAGELDRLRAALELHPQDPELHGELGLLLYELGFQTEAIGHLRFAFQHSAAPARWRRSLKEATTDGFKEIERNQLQGAFADLAEGRADEALALFQYLKAKRPRSVAAWSGARGALHALGRASEVVELEARWRRSWPPHRAGVEAVLARPLNGRGLVFDARDPLPVRPIEEVLTRVESASDLQRTPNSYFEIDADTQDIECAPVIPLEPDGSDAIFAHGRTNRRLMARFDDAVLAGRGLVVSRTGEVVSELLSGRNFGTELQDGALRFRPDAIGDGAGNVQVFDEPALLMAGPIDRIYGDWINQYPPRLAIAEAVGVDCAPVVRKDLGDRYVEMLAALGVDPNRVMRHNQYASVFPQLYVPSWPLKHRHAPMPGWFDVYRRAWAPPPAERRRVYLTRLRVDNRSLINEAEIAEIFARRGFDIVAPETLGMREMIELFAGPSIVAGPYGSAMRSLVFSRQKPTVFAIMPPYSRTFIEGSALFLAQAGVRFAWVHGRFAPTAEGEHPNAAAWTIDAGLVESRLEALLDHLATNP